MTRAIQSVAGVTNVEVSFERKEAEVVSTRCSDDVGQDIADSLGAAGYGGTVVKTTPSS